MMRSRPLGTIFAGLTVAFIAAGGPMASAQESLPRDGSVLPIPDPPFEGKIGRTIEESVPDYPQPVRPPKGAPNVLLILLDDVGFGMTSTFGGPVPTPNLDKLAKTGLTYTRFHTTALCSPTRAALLTGRNHHSVGTGVIIEMGTGYPGYTGIIPKSTAMVAEVLRDNGYATAMFGKAHNTPEPEISPAGPFDHWPTGQGFQYFYGFNQGETNQYYPTLYRDTTPVAQPKSAEDGYQFTEDMTDEAIAWTHNIRAADPDKPWFVYFSTAGVHAPHQSPKEWRDKYKGEFDYGWDKQREMTIAKQLEMGIIPKGTKLTPRPKEIPAWDDQSADAKKVYTRLMENYAGYVLPLDDRRYERVADPTRPVAAIEKPSYTYYPGTSIVHPLAAPQLLGREHTITAYVTIPEAGAEGVLASAGGEFGGWSLFLKDGKLHYAHNYLKIKEYDVASPQAVAPGKRRLAVHFVPKEKSLKPDFFTGKVSLLVDGKQVGEARDIKMAGQYSAITGYGLLIGRNTGTPVSHDYEPPFAFTGGIEKVTIEVEKASK